MLPGSPPDRRHSAFRGRAEPRAQRRFKFGSSPSGSTTSTQSAQPWGPQQQPLQNIFNQAGNLFNQGGPQVYSGPLAAPVAPETQQSWAMQTARAQQGNPLNASAQGYGQSVLNGDYLNANPWLDKMAQSAARPLVNNFMEATAPGIISHAISVGRHGSGAEGTQMGQAADILAQNLSAQNAALYGGNYAQERQNQQQMAGMAPTLASSDYTDIAALNDVGAQRQAQGQNQINAQQQQFNQSQMQPYNALDLYLKTIMGAGQNPTQTTTQPYFTNPGASALGGAMAGNMIGSSLGSPWLGTAAGAVMGML